MTLGPGGNAQGPGMDAVAALAGAAGGERLAETLAALADGHLLVDGDLRITRLSEGARSLLGAGADAAIGQEVVRVLPAPPGEGPSWREALEGRAPARLVAGNPLDSGLRLEVHALPVPQGLLCYLRDVTDRDAWQAALRTSEERYAFVIRATQDPLWDWNLVTGELSWNAGLPRSFGIPEAEMEPTLAWWEGHLHPDDRARILASLDGAIEGGAEDWTEEYRFRRADGTYARVLDRGFVIRDDAGLAVRMLGSMIDVSRSARIEEELRRSEERYRRFFDEDLTGDYISTPEGSITACNPAFARIFGFDTVEEALRVDVTSLYPTPADRQEVLARLRDEGAVEGREMELRRRDGAAIHVIANIRGEFDAAGRLLETRGYLFDITAHKRLEEQLHQSRKMEAVGKLAGGVAHDFNNLLTAIQGHAELLLMDHPEGSSVHEELLQIRAAARRAATLTRQLLAFSRRQVLRPRVFELDATLREMQKTLGRMLGEQVVLEFELEAPGASIRADSGQMEQVVLNLVLNARDAMPRGGHLRIATEVRDAQPGDPAWSGPPVPAGSYVVLSVTDDGTGMDAEVRQRIFEPFFTTKEQGKGTGLGLSTVYGIVQQSGGYVQVRTAPGEGSRFEVYLPRALSEEERVGKGPESEREGGTVLLVEDEPSVRTLARKILERGGFQVIEAGDGEEALRTLSEREGPTDLVLTDVLMPRMGGLELAERLREDRPELPVIFMSGYSDQALSARGTPGDPPLLVEKPFSPQTLLRRVQQALP